MFQYRMHSLIDWVWISTCHGCLWSISCMSSNLVYGRPCSSMQFGSSMQQHQVEGWLPSWMKGTQAGDSHWHTTSLCCSGGLQQHSSTDIAKCCSSVMLSRDLQTTFRK